ncbi:hypothetical protein OROGR_018133 [Orobanche gracilis]
MLSRSNTHGCYERRGDSEDVGIFDYEKGRILPILIDHPMDMLIRVYLGNRRHLSMDSFLDAKGLRISISSKNRKKEEQKDVIMQYSCFDLLKNAAFRGAGFEEQEVVGTLEVLDGIGTGADHKISNFRDRDFEWVPGPVLIQDSRSPEGIGTGTIKYPIFGIGISGCVPGPVPILTHTMPLLLG